MNISKEENVFSFIASGINITHILSLWLNPIIVTIGLICNLITICVFLRKCLRQMQISIYIISLAISDICVLVYILLNWLDDIILFDSNAWCKFHGYIDLVFCSTSTWNLVALAHQRWLAVASKNQIYTQQKTSTKNYFEVLIIWLFSALANIWYPILIYKNESENSCLVEYKILFKLFGIFSILITYFTPFVFIVTFNSLLIRSLRKRIERRRQMGLALPHGETLISQLRRHLQEQHQNNAMSDKTINKMLITISVSFVICKLFF